MRFRVRWLVSMPKCYFGAKRCDAARRKGTHYCLQFNFEVRLLCGRNRKIIWIIARVRSASWPRVSRVTFLKNTRDSKRERVYFFFLSHHKSNILRFELLRKKLHLVRRAIFIFSFKLSSSRADSRWIFFRQLYRSGRLFWLSRRIVGRRLFVITSICTAATDRKTYVLNNHIVHYNIII